MFFNNRDGFYKKTIEELILNKEASILVCGGGKLDFSVFKELGYLNVTILNIDERMNEKQYFPFKWVFGNAEYLPFEDNSYDFVVIHASIHHCQSPHKVINEMFRVSKKGIIGIESRDSFVNRIMEKFELVQTYEHAAVFYNDCSFGGVNNSQIPNYVYRWTEREVEKTIKSYAPQYNCKFKYKYGTSFPCTPELEKKGNVKSLFLKLLKPFFKIFTIVFPRQQNLFAFFVIKNNLESNLWPWLVMENNELKFNKEWGNNRYKP